MSKAPEGRPSWLKRLFGCARPLREGPVRKGGTNAPPTTPRPTSPPPGQGRKMGVTFAKAAARFRAANDEDASADFLRRFSPHHPKWLAREMDSHDWMAIFAEDRSGAAKEWVKQSKHASRVLSGARAVVVIVASYCDGVPAADDSYYFAVRGTPSFRAEQLDLSSRKEFADAVQIMADGGRRACPRCGGKP